MEKDVLLALLKETAEQQEKDGWVEFSSEDQATLLVVGHGTVLNIEAVSRLAVRDGYVLVESGRSDTYGLALDRVVGLRVQRARKGGAGFLP